MGRAEVERVAVLGGGIGALSAAFELTDPSLEGRYEVTVYQPGWRLGGKCASGRGGDSKRIEEHGLHIWFGFYDNAFDLIQRCYEQWQSPAGSPFHAWTDAFKPCSEIVLFESWNGQWTPWHLAMPVDDLVPGSRHDVSEWDFFIRLADWLLEQWGLVRRQGIPAAATEAGRAHHRDWFEKLAGELGHGLEGLEFEAATHFLQLAATVARAAGDVAGVAHIAGLLGRFKEFVFAHVLGDADDPYVRRFALMLDFWTTAVVGIVDDGVLVDGFGALNDIDLRAWLASNGAAEITVNQAAFIQALYDLVFAYVDGDRNHCDLAAGKALQAMIRIVACYKGAPLWKMQAGMGDTVFTPLYDVLRARGVRFEFFHWVTALRASGDSVSAIEVQPQARVVSGGAYAPTIDVGGLPCWPSEPLWQQLEGGDSLRERGVNFEAEPDPCGLEALTLKAGEDFEHIVLGISVGALPAICGELAVASEPFRLMLEHSDTVMTEGIQLWLAQSCADLGWQFESSITTSYVGRADTYSNMAHLLPREQWPAGAVTPAEVAYLCGTLAHDGIATQADADARVRDNAVRWLQENARTIWPEFEWDTLVDPSGAVGEQRLDAQFLRANFIPSERYVMTRAGSVRYRLGAGESGFSNLALAGDWTRNGIDGGSVEAAVTSGMQAARAISGHPQQIQHETGWLVDDRRASA